MKLLAALRVGRDILEAFEWVKKFAPTVPHPVRWTWRIGKWRFRLNGDLLAERVD